MHLSELLLAHLHKNTVFHHLSEAYATTPQKVLIWIKSLEQTLASLQRHAGKAVTVSKL